MAPSIPQSERVAVTLRKERDEGYYRIIEEASGGLRYSGSSGTHTVYLRRGRHIVLMYSSNGYGWTQSGYTYDYWYYCNRGYHATLYISVSGSSKGSFYFCSGYTSSDSFTV